MNRYFGSFLLLFVVIRSTSSQVCSLSNGCGVIGGKTRLFCKVTAPFERWKLNWFGPAGRILIGGGSVLDTVDIEVASDGFYLIILKTTKYDNGTYICEYSFVPHDCIVTQEDFQALMCEQKVDGHKVIITITYRLQGNLPKISLMKSTGEAITGWFDSVIDNGFLKEIVWRSDDLSVGTYNYKVTGKCGFLTACSGTVDIAGTTGAPSELKDWEIVLIVTTCVLITAILAVVMVMVYRFCFKNRTKDTKGCIARLSSYSCSQCPHEAVPGHDVTVTAVKDTASEKLVNSTDPDLETVDEIQTKKEKRSKLTEEEKKTEVPRDGEEQHENNNVATLVTFFQQT